VGFSIGGYTALNLLGAPPRLRALVEHRRIYPVDALPIAPGDAGLSLDTLNTMLATYPDDIPTECDERFKAAVLLAPMCALFEDEDLRHINVPVSLYCAERDNVLREPYHAGRLQMLLPQLKHFECVPAAGHFSFLAPFPGTLHDELAELAIDAPGFSRGAFHERMNEEMVAFFNLELSVARG